MCWTIGRVKIHQPPAHPHTQSLRRLTWHAAQQQRGRGSDLAWPSTLCRECVRALGDQWPTFTHTTTRGARWPQACLWPIVGRYVTSKVSRLVLLGPEPGWPYRHCACYSKLVQKGRVFRLCSLETTLHIRFQVCDQYLWLQDFPSWLDPKPTSYHHITYYHISTTTYHTYIFLSIIWHIMWSAMYFLLYAKLAANV